ncbi:MAG: nitrate reductase associated protein [Cyanobacteria bacterium P01_D01_bin.2]
MSQFFQFEADFVDSLRCIPMQVRYKLDTSGIKLKLHHWSKFFEEDRQRLVRLPCQTTTEIQRYHDYLQELVQARAGEVAKELPVDDSPAWEKSSVIPTSVSEKAAETGVSLELEHWERLTEIQRFALIKLSRSSHENRNFLPALKEFELV